MKNTAVKQTEATKWLYTNAGITYHIRVDGRIATKISFYNEDGIILENEHGFLEPVTIHSDGKNFDKFNSNHITSIYTKEFVRRAKPNFTRKENFYIPVSSDNIWGKEAHLYIYVDNKDVKIEADGEFKRVMACGTKNLHFTYPKFMLDGEIINKSQNNGKVLLFGTPKVVEYETGIGREIEKIKEVFKERNEYMGSSDEYFLERLLKHYKLEKREKPLK